MKFKRVLAFMMCSALLAGMPASAFAEEASTEAVEASEESSLLSEPTDFTFDPVTGDYSFNATDERTAYYFIRIYKVENGIEEASYTASTARIKGNTTGVQSGTTDLSALGWGTYTAKLISFAASGSEYEAPEALSIGLVYGADLPLERPEMLAMYSGDTAELVIDWTTVDDYYNYEYLPYMKFTFYSDEALENEVYSDTVDLTDLAEHQGLGPGGTWGYEVASGDFLYPLADYDWIHDLSAYDLGTPIDEIYFTYNNYKYTLESTGLEAGTYYVTAQAVSRDEYVADSQVSDAVEVTLTAEAMTSEYETSRTEMWGDPYPWWSGPFVITETGMFGDLSSVAGEQPERIDSAKTQPLVGLAIEE
jgi:hypothetical protein